LSKTRIEFLKCFTEIFLNFIYGLKLLIDSVYIEIFINYYQFTFLRQWIKDSYEFYDALCKMKDASYAGVTNISGYIFANSSRDTVKVRF